MTVVGDPEIGVIVSTDGMPPRLPWETPAEPEGVTLLSNSVEGVTVMTLTGGVTPPPYPRLGASEADSPTATVGV